MITTMKNKNLSVMRKQCGGMFFLREFQRPIPQICDQKDTFHSSRLHLMNSHQQPIWFVCFNLELALRIHRNERPRWGDEEPRYRISSSRSWFSI